MSSTFLPPPPPTFSRACADLSSFLLVVPASVSVISLVLLVPIVEPQLSRPLFDESFTTRARSFFPPLSLSLPFTIARHLCLSGPTFTFRKSLVLLVLFVSSKYVDRRLDPSPLPPQLPSSTTLLLFPPLYPLSSSAHCPGSPESRPINGSPNHLL